MLKKTISVFLVVIVGFFIGYHGYRLAYAFAIPGVDRPFDPPDYYSETSVSYADSPSPFFYKDLAGGGGTVLDPLRKIKSALFSGDFSNLVAIFTSKTNNDVINTSPFSSSVLNETSNNVSNIHSNTSAIGNSAATLEARDGTLFRRPDRYDEDTNSYSENEQLTWLDKTYKTIAQSAKSSLEDSSTQETTLDGIVENAYGAEGDLQAAQAAAQMAAFTESVNARRNQLLANYASLKSAHNMKAEDDQINATRTTGQVSIQISDPYNQTTEQKTVYTRPDAPGFKDF